MLDSTGPTVRLDDENVFRFESGLWTGEREPLVKVPVVRNTNFTDDGRLDFSDVAMIEVEARYLPRKQLIPGDIVIERSGGGPSQPVGRASLFERSDGAWAFSNFTSRLRVVDQTVMNPRFVHLYLHWLYLSGATESLQRRTTGIRNLDFTAYKATAIPLVPLSLQEEVVQSLAAIRRSIDARKNELALERECKAALMHHLFAHGTRGEGRKETEIGEVPESWRVCRLGEMAKIAYGLTVNQARRQSSQSAPYLTVANVTRGALRLSEVKQIGILANDADTFRVNRGDVLFVEGSGNPQLLGSAAIWNDELPFVLHQNHLIRARTDASKVLPEWVMNYANSGYGRAQLLGQAKTSSGLHNINSRIIAGLLLPTPDLAEQQVIVDGLTACDQKTIALEREVAVIDELFRAMLDDLMSGRVLT